MRAAKIHRIAAAIAAVALLWLPGCGDWPKDPNGTLDRVRGGVVRVGVSASLPWADFEGGRASGVEVTLVEQLAEELDARIEWRHAGETALLQDLEQDKLDLVIGGLIKSSPWSKRVAFTEPYHTHERDGVKQAHVWAVPMGENGWVVEIERFLHANAGQVQQLLREAGEAQAP